MTDIRSGIEASFGRLGRLLFRNPRKVLLFVFAFVGVLGAQLPRLVVDTSSEAMLHEDDPFRLEYNAFRDQFGRDEIIIVAVGALNVFDTAFLRKLKSFHSDLEEEVPYLRRVHSLINATSIRGRGDTLLVDELLSCWPEQDIDLDALREHVLGDPLYLNNIVSPDGTLTAVLIEAEASIAEGPRHRTPVGSSPGKAPTKQRVIASIINWVKISNR